MRHRGGPVAQLVIAYSLKKAPAGVHANRSSPVLRRRGFKRQLTSRPPFVKFFSGAARTHLGTDLPVRSG
jgi:hypothetical protein